MTFSAFIMGICHPERIEYLKRSLEYLDKQKFPFAQKVLAIDEFDGYTFPLNLKKTLEKRGWTILVDSHRSRTKSMDHAFNVINSDYIFYNEDDIEAPLPKISDLTKIFKKFKLEGRECGMVSLSIGGSDIVFKKNKYGDLSEISQNIIIEYMNTIIFRRLENKRNDFFFEFPALFIKANLFKMCHKKANNNFPGLQVEMGLTKAWFKLGLDKKYYKCCISNKRILNVIGSKNPAAQLDSSLVIKFLDPKQGSSPLGGGHTYATKSTTFAISFLNSKSLLNFFKKILRLFKFKNQSI